MLNSELIFTGSIPIGPSVAGHVLIPIPKQPYYYSLHYCHPIARYMLTAAGLEVKNHAIAREYTESTQILSA